MKVRWARSATKHRINRSRIRHVIEQSGLRFRVAPPPGQVDDRLVYLGDDRDGVPIEVMAVEIAPDELLVIHAMPLRAKYRRWYEEARTWRG